MPPMRGRPLSPEMQATLDAIRARVGFTAPANNFGYTGHQDPATGQWIGGGGPNPMTMAAAAYGGHQRGQDALSIAAARWNYAMLQYRSGRGPHPGPHPIAGVDSQMPAQTPGQTPGQTPAQPPTGIGAPRPVAPPGTPSPLPGPVGPLPPGGDVSQGWPPPGLYTPPGHNVSSPGGPVIDPEYTGPPGVGSYVPVPTAPIGGTNVPSNVGPLGTSRGGGTNYLSYLLGR